MAYTVQMLCDICIQVIVILLWYSNYLRWDHAREIRIQRGDSPTIRSILRIPLRGTVRSRMVITKSPLPPF